MSSQMVDDAKLSWSIETSGQSIRGERPGASEPKQFTEVTQNYVFWDQNIARDVYLPFHFVPGDPAACAAARADRNTNPLAVSPDSDNVRSLLIEALTTKNLYRIGIALHSYADTWAHQNFTGTQDGFNALEPSGFMASMKLAVSVLPAVGHLQAGTTPDLPQAWWSDSRLEPGRATIDNSVRFLDAARMIYRFLRTSRRASFKDESFVLDPLHELWADRKASKNDELAVASDYVIYFDVPSYDPNRWTVDIGAQEYSTGDMLKTISTEGFSSEWRASPLHSSLVQGAIPISKYRNSPFEEWNRAAHAHRDAFHSLMRKKGIQI
jgi:hypothetical protein